VPGCCEHGDETSCYIKSGEFVKQSNEYQLFSKDLIHEIS
jgi:hypothetical protein